jgi:hypothetical protein
MTAVTLPAALPRARLNAVTAGGPGFVAVGATEPEDVGPVDTLILTSPDGATWAPVALGDLAQVGTLSDVVAVPAGLVAVGLEWVSDERKDAVAVASADGLTWQASTDRDLRDAYMTSVTAWGDGVAAVGCVLLDPDDLCSRPVVWTSTDGLEWDRFRIPVAAGEPNVVASGDGLLVILGISAIIADGRPVITTTRDLATWTRRELGFYGALGSAVVDGDRIVAAGTDVDAPGDVGRRGVVVYSPNAGRRWVRLPATAPAESEFAGISIGEEVITYGSRENADQRSLPAAWTSRIGVDWDRLRGSGSGLGSVADLVAFPDRPGGIAVGGTGSRGDVPAVWLIEARG